MQIKGLFNRAKERIKAWASTISPPMGDESFAEWWGMKFGRKKHRMTGEVTYFTCLKMLSETIAKMPIKFYQKTDSGIIEAEPNDVSYLLQTRPNPFMTPTIFWNTVEMNRNHFGNAYVYIRRSFKKQKYGGEIKTHDLWIMPSDSVTILIDDAGIFSNKGRLWYKYTDRYSGDTYIFPTEDVMHFKTSHTFDGITGQPVQEILRETLGGAIHSQEYLNNLYETGLTAKAALEYTGELNQKAEEKLVKTFENFGAGSKNAGKIIPIPLGMKLTPLDVKLTDSQFFELKKYTALQIAGAMGVKPNQINNYEKSSYSNSEMQQLSFYVDTELFILTQYEQEINYKLLSVEDTDAGKYFKFNEKVLMRTDSKTQMSILKEAVAGSIYMPNEARRKLDMSDEEGGDQLIANGNVIPLKNVGVQYIKQPKNQEEPDPEPPEDETTEPEEPENEEGGGEDDEKI